MEMHSPNSKSHKFGQKIIQGKKISSFLRFLKKKINYQSHKLLQAVNTNSDRINITSINSYFCS